MPLDSSWRSNSVSPIPPFASAERANCSTFRSKIKRQELREDMAGGIGGQANKLSVAGPVMVQAVSSQTFCYRDLNQVLADKTYTVPGTCGERAW